MPVRALARTARSPGSVWHSIFPPPVPIVYPRGRTGSDRRRLTRLPDHRERLDRTQPRGPDEPTDQERRPGPPTGPTVRPEPVTGGRSAATPCQLSGNDHRQPHGLQAGASIARPSRVLGLVAMVPARSHHLATRRSRSHQSARLRPTRVRDAEVVPERAARPVQHDRSNHQADLCGRAGADPVEESKP
jgi:hypothetical protein